MSEKNQEILKKEIQPLTYSVNDIIEGEKILKILENQKNFEKMKKNFIVQKIAQSKLNFYFFLGKKNYEVLKFELKKLKMAKDKNNNEIMILEKENKFLEEMIDYTLKSKPI